MVHDNEPTNAQLEGAPEVEAHGSVLELQTLGRSKDILEQTKACISLISVVG
ncbi:hypothetical protein ACQEV9_44180 [Streptomyces chartreusis]|uniref:hypothetical protein n=1 Tax=Streptomyces chartreusis TaxID=1969 RepID=UPI003D8AA347